MTCTFGDAPGAVLCRCARAPMQVGLEVDPRTGHACAAASHQVGRAYPFDTAPSVCRRIARRAPALIAEPHQLDRFVPRRDVDGLRIDGVVADVGRVLVHVVSSVSSGAERARSCAVGTLANQRPTVEGCTSNSRAMRLFDQPSSRMAVACSWGERSASSACSSVASGVRMSSTVKCVIANSTTGGTAATAAASTLGTSASAATTAWIEFAVTETAAAPASSVHGYQAERDPARATTATVETTMTPSTMSGHAHACPAPMPERAARSAREVNESQNAPAAMKTVPATAVMIADRRARMLLMPRSVNP